MKRGLIARRLWKVMPKYVVRTGLTASLIVWDGISCADVIIDVGWDYRLASPW